MGLTKSLSGLFWVTRVGHRFDKRTKDNTHVRLYSQANHGFFKIDRAGEASAAEGSMFIGSVDQLLVDGTVEDPGNPTHSRMHFWPPTPIFVGRSPSG